MTDPSAPSPDTPAASTPAGPGLMQKVLRILPKVAVLAGLAGAAFALVVFVVRPMFPAPGAAEKPPQKAGEKFGRVVALDSVVVNVAQTEGRRYLKATVHVEVSDDEKTVKEVEARKAQLLDLIVATLTRKSLSDLTSPEALDTLRNEVLARVSQALGAERVRRVYITEFVVQ
jgi:flagellar basal body-associated protein FliL